MSIALGMDRVRWRMSPEARGLVLVTAILLAFGLAVLYSASMYDAMRIGDGSSTYFLFRQLAGVGIGIVLFALVAKFDAENWRMASWPLIIIAILAMVATLMPGMSPTLGSRRFLYSAGVQPSEFAKLAVIVWTAMLVDKKGEDRGFRRLSKGLMPFLIVIGMLGITAVLEPDYSVALHFVLLMAVVLYSGGARIGHFVFLSFASLPVLWAMMQTTGYAMDRVVAFLNPQAAGSDAKLFQVKQALVAAGSGGFFGTGFGQGRQQTGYVFAPYTDFIGSVVAEEWGFIGFMAVTLLFAAYGYFGFKIAAQARNKFLQLVAIGLTVNILVTAYVHLGVVINLLPTTGLTLPFISYGRSNLLISLITTAILCNIGSQQDRVQGTHATDPMAVPAR